MRSQHHNEAAGPVHQAGRVDGPGLLYGGIGLVLAVAMQMMGLFKRGEAKLFQFLLDPVFHGEQPGVLSLPVLVIVAAVFCFGLAFAVLDSAGTWRRVILGGTALIVVLAMVPTLAVWNIYFSPFLPAVAVFWSWFCVMMYANHHTMPCDGLSSNFQTPNTKVQAASQPEKERSKKKEEAEKEVNDPDAKYRPKGEKQGDQKHG